MCLTDGILTFSYCIFYCNMVQYIKDLWKVGTDIMSNREVAATIFNGFTDEQIDAFIMLFADDNTKARVETEAILADPDSERFGSFEEVMEDIFTDESDV